MPYVSLPRRFLDRRELRGLVDDLARSTETWRPLVEFPSDRRHYVSLHREEYIDVWLLCWTPDSDTGWHDHDVSSGAVAVVDGAITESNPRIGGAHAETPMAAGTSFSFGPEHIHRLTGSADQSVSIHAYSPPLGRLGQYSIDDGGLMRRISVTYTDELRPIDATV